MARPDAPAGAQVPGKQNNLLNKTKKEQGDPREKEKTEKKERTERNEGKEKNETKKEREIKTQYWIKGTSRGISFVLPADEDRRPSYRYVLTKEEKESIILQLITPYYLQICTVANTSSRGKKYK